MNLRPDELIPDETDFYSSLNGSRTRGSYSTFQFVLRLRDDIRSALQGGKIDQESIKANSTAIHENIHWWQGVGSNFGLLLSLSNIGFASMCIDQFRILIEKNIACKSLIEFDRKYILQNGIPDIPEVNRILNSFYDFEYAKLFLLDNKNIDKILQDSRFFLNVGHCFHLFWGKGVNTIASIVDREYKFLPNVEDWIPKFKEMSSREVEGFYIDSPVTISQIGIKAIYEGQAIFNQLQYLTIALDEDLKYQDFKSMGMLHGIYLEAFEIYLQATGLSEPLDLLDPAVGLFLLVCDMSINPTNGFPLQVYDYESFISKNDPGARFILICKAIGESDRNFTEMIAEYSKEEYIDVENQLSEILGYKSAYNSLNSVLEWLRQEEIVKLLAEEAEYKFLNYNFPVRLLFSKFLRFQEDKYEFPNVFCWFGIHASSTRTTVPYEDVERLYRKHHALFVDDYDHTIKPVIFSDKYENNISETFNTFYAYYLVLDMILKWVCERGDFTYNYDWLSSMSKEDLMAKIDKQFADLFGIYPRDITVI